MKISFQDSLGSTQQFPSTHRAALHLPLHHESEEQGNDDLLVSSEQAVVHQLAATTGAGGTGPPLLQARLSPSGRAEGLQPIGAPHSGRPSPGHHKVSRGYSVIPEENQPPALVT